MKPPLSPSAEDAALVSEVLTGDVDRFREIIGRYESRVFGTVRRYARRESEVDDIAQEIFIKAYRHLGEWRGEAPFEHWLMRLAVRTCYDALRSHRRDLEQPLCDLTEDESRWIGNCAGPDGVADETAEAAATLVHRLMERLSPANRLVLTLLEIEDRSVKEVAALTGWSPTLVKVRAFRARAEMKKLLGRIEKDRYL